MNFRQTFILASLVSLGLNGCAQNGNYGQDGGYGDPYYGDAAGYGTPYGTDQGSESGDVVSIPGDGGAYGSPPSYGGAGAAPQVPSYESPATSSRTYTVKKGDNLYRIGKTHGVTMQEIIQQNGLQSTTIHPGQQLIIP